MPIYSLPLVPRSANNSPLSSVPWCRNSASNLRHSLAGLDHRPLCCAQRFESGDDTVAPPAPLLTHGAHPRCWCATAHTPFGRGQGVRLLASPQRPVLSRSLSKAAPAASVNCRSPARAAMPTSGTALHHRRRTVVIGRCGWERLSVALTVHPRNSFLLCNGSCAASDRRSEVSQYSNRCILVEACQRC